jgi:ubiquinone/menaquinone biosynthesis C-methylase UbiE
MTAIADSNAYRSSERILSQHQAALTLLQSRVSTPGVSHLSWLDLACGRGQIIVFLDKNLSEVARAKIEYWAYDLDQDFARETRKTAEQLGFANFNASVGDLADFDRILPSDKLFDFITLTNTVHEIEPTKLAQLLVSSMQRLTPHGSLFIYDMETITPPELGAVPWSREHVRRIILRMLDALGATTYRPEVGLWQHSTTTGWNVQLERQHVDLSRDDFAAISADAVQATRIEICELVRTRLGTCQKSLEAFTRYGVETAEEEEEKGRLLLDFWSLSRALEHDQ